MFEYRKMEELDLKKCAILFQECFQQKPWNENWTYEQAYQRLSQILSYPYFIGYVIYDGENLVGMLCGRILTYLSYQEMTLEEICISNQYQGLGIGSQMIEFLKKELKQQEVSSLVLNTVRGQLSDSFYVKNGFEINESIVFMSCQIDKNCF